MDGFVSKPIDRARLLSILKSLVAHAEETNPVARNANFEEERTPTVATDYTFDLAATMQRLGGDRQLLGELAELFRTTVPELLTEIHDGVAAADHHRVRLAAHRLKGMAGNFGAAATMAAAAHLETLADSPSMNGFADAAQELVAEVDRLLKALADQLDS